jgi:hypothetical protein
MRKILNARLGSLAGVTALSAGLIVAGTVGAQADKFVTSKDIKNQTIRSVDIGANGVGASELQPHAVRKHHIAKNSVGWVEINEYTQDKIKDIAHDEATEHAAEQGESGKDGVSGHEPRNAEKRWSGTTTNETVVNCPEGKVAMGGGYEVDGTANGEVADVVIADNGPVWNAESQTVTGWRVAGVPNGQVNVKTWVVCAAAN